MMEIEDITCEVEMETIEIEWIDFEDESKIIAEIMDLDKETKMIEGIMDIEDEEVETAEIELPKDDDVMIVAMVQAQEPLALRNENDFGICNRNLQPQNQSVMLAKSVYQVIKDENIRLREVIHIIVSLPNREYRNKIESYSVYSSLRTKINEKDLVQMFF